MNECIFLVHLALASLFVWPFLKLNKEGLTCWIGLQSVLANLFVLKQITLFGFTVTCSDVYAVGCALGLNLLQEYYGKEAAKRAIWISFFLLVFFVVMSWMQLLYVPSDLDYAHPAYNILLQSTPRLVAASIGTFFVVQWVDLQFFNFLKRRFSHLSLTARNIASLSVSQAIDTLLFTIFGLWGLVSDLAAVFIVSYLVKLAVSIVLSMRKHEPVSI